MSWTLNQLEKPIEKTYIPGEPGVPGEPGSPFIPARDIVVTTVEPAVNIYSELPPQAYDEIFDGGGGLEVYSGGYRFFQGRRAELVGIIGVEGGSDVYVYQREAYTVTRTTPVPAIPGRLPQPGIPPTPAQIAIDYRLGWNAGALGPAPLDDNNAVVWRFFPGSVGTVVGLSRTISPQDQGYRGMPLAVMAQSGQYIVIDTRSVVTAPLPFTEFDVFSIKKLDTGKWAVLVNGTVIYERHISGEVIADSSLYAGYDLIWDAREVEGATIPVYTGFSATTASNTAAVAVVSRALGPGTARGLAGATSRSNAVAGSVVVNGSVVAVASAVTATHGEAAGFATPTIGEGTASGAAGATTRTEAGVLAVENASGSASLSFKPMAGAGSGPGVADGWAGDYPGAAAQMATMTVESENDTIAPSIGIGAGVMVPATMSGVGLTGEVSLSADMSLRAILGGGSEDAYGGASVTINPLYGIGGSQNLFAGITGTGEGIMSFRLSVLAEGQEANRNGAVIRLRSRFTGNGYGGAQGGGGFRFTVDAQGTGENIGSFYGVIGYA